jgi:hypothetical protein
VADDGLLLLLSEGGGTLTRLGLVKGLACSNHGGDESLLLSVPGSSGDLGHGRGVILLPLSSGSSDDGLLLVDGEVGGVAQHGRQDSGGGASRR